MTTLVVSINIFTQIDYVIEQVNNIDYFTKDFEKVYIIFNCGEEIYNIIQEDPLKNDRIKIIINPDTINKRRFTGTIANGVFSNIKYIIENNIVFDYFLILSSRTIFADTLTKNKIDEQLISTKEKIIDLINNNTYKNKVHVYNKFNHFSLLDKENIHGFWYFHDKRIVNSKWYNKFISDFDIIIGGKHEGLCMDSTVIMNMYNYDKNNREIMDDIWASNWFTEECILQTLAFQCRRKNNLSYSFIKQAIVAGTGHNKRNIDDFETVKQNYINKMKK